ncbi:ABC transporter permease [Piscinibacter sp.]|jgi:rhamnose transport system permease protein|uniref:ABC transporter permease n=1 Tax=Piscinibacter sp. TaxID=1903157 RepID=UPI00355A11E6
MTTSTSVKHLIADSGRFGWAAVLRRWETLLLAVLVMVVIVGGLSLKEFFDPNNLADSTFNFSEKALIALAMALLIIVREIDISVSGILAVASVAMGYANTQGVPAVGLAVIGIGVGALCGSLNGLLVTRFGIPSIVVTIGTMSLFRGIALVVLGDQAFTNYPEALSEWGQGYVFGFIPREFVVLLVFAALFALLLHGTTFGRRIYAIGSNPVAARFAGIPVDRYRLALFILAGTMAGLAAVLLTGRIGSTRPNIALGWELEAITMVILGGVSIAGGAGTIVGVLLAVFTLGMVTYGLGLANVPGIIMTIVIGALLLVTITVPVLLRVRGAAARS